MSEYTLTLPDGINSFEHNGQEYGAGETYEASSACDAIAFYNAARSTNAELGRANNTSNFWQNTEAECASSPAPVDPDAPPTGTTPPVNDAPPTEDGDDADQQSAPQLDPPIEGERQTPPPQSPDVEEPPRRPPPGEVDPDNSDETPQEQTGGGDPVDLFSGRFTLREVDLQLNTSVLPLEMVRTYQSGQSYFGPFGWGWDHNHNRYLRELTNGGVAHWTGDLNEEIHMPEGGSWRAAPGVFHVLERLGGPATRYVLKAPEGLESTFEQPPGWTDGERIPLVKVADRFGNTLVYTYDARSRLSMVTDDDGRFLAFHYGDCDLLEAVEDQAGRRVVYEHHNDLEHLACVRLPATDDHPDGLRRAFEYAPASLPQPLRHAITRIRDGDGLVFLENRYEQDPSSFSYGRVIEQLAADYLYQFRYTQLQYVPAHADFLNIPSVRVELMTPDFALYTHTYNYRGDLLDYRFRLVADKSFRVVASSFGYDTEGNRIRTTLPDGSEELRRFSHTDPDPRMRGKLRQIELRARAGFPSPSRITLRIDYEPNFQLVKRIRDERGGSTDYVYDLDTAPGPGAVGKLERIILPDAVLPDGSVQNSDIRLKIDARGRLEELTSALGHTQRYIYGGPGPEAGLPVQTIRDVGGLDITETISRDANGNVASTEDGLGARTELTHDALDRLVQIAMPDVAGKRGIVRLNYDTQGDLVALWRPRGDYDDAVLAGAPITDTLTRNVQGHIVSTTFGANTANPITQTQKTDYRGLVLCATGPEGTVTQQCFDERGLLLERTETGADGSTTKQQWVYDRAGRLQVMRSGQDSPTETRYDYDAFGRLAKVTLPDGAEQSYEYGPGDSILDEQLRGNDGTGTVRLLARKSQTYDARGRIVTETRHAFEDDPTTAQLLTVSNTFDGDDRLIETEDHRGAITRMDYDRANRLTALTDAAGNRTEHQYDAAGRRTRTRTIDLEDGGSVQRDTLFTYDGRGRLSRMTLPGGEVTDYDYDDRNTQVRILAPLGFEQRQRFGQLGELLERTVDPSGVNASHRWTYDKSLRPLSYSDPVGDVTRFFHDGLGRMVRTTLPNGFESKRSYSQDGRVATETVSGGGVIKLGYDAAGRLSQMQGGASPISANIADHSFAYDARGHITRASADGLVTQRKFDSLGRLVEDSTDGLTHRNSFDDLSGTIDRHWSDGRHERIESDVMGRPTKIEQLAPGTVASNVADLAQFALAGPMSVEQRTLFGSITTATRFDASRRVLDQEVTAGGGAIETQAYRYDALGRTNVAQSALQGWTRLAEHDGPGRLHRTAEGFVAPPLTAGAGSVAEQATDIGAVQAAAAGAARTREFTYDSADARLTRSENGAAPDVYTYAAGKMMTAAAAEVMSNDANARRTGDGRNRYEYDALGRVTRILTQDGAAERMRMTYDALGRLQQSQTDGGPIHRHGYFGQVEVEEHAGGALLRQFSADPYLPLPLAVHQGGSSFAALNDQRLNRVGLADITGNVVERYSFDPFGTPRVMAPDGSARPASQFGLDPVFGGMRYLPGPGLYHTRYRVADPRHGVFLTSDPFGPLDSPNVYAYARQNPADFVDPEGDLAFLAGLLIAAVAGAAIGGLFNGVRQAIAIGEGSQKEWEWGQFGLAVGMGAVIAPAMVVAPELVIPLAAYGVVNGGAEIARGNYYTGAFDVVTSVLPFGFKGVRTGAVGRGSAIGQARGLGPRTPMSTRVGRFRLIGDNARHMLPRLRGRRIGLGFSQARNSPEGHVAVILENGERGMWFVEKNAMRDPYTRELRASFFETEPPPDAYVHDPTRPFVYRGMRVSEQAVRTATEHARGRLAENGVEPFDFKTANCSHFGCDVLSAAGFRGLGNGRGSGLWSDFSNLSLARTMMRSATFGPPQLGDDAAASEDAPPPPKKQ